MKGPDKTEPDSPFQLAAAIVLLFIIYFVLRVTDFLATPVVVDKFFSEHPSFVIGLGLLAISIRVAQTIDDVRNAAREHTSFKEFAIYSARYLTVLSAIVIFSLLVAGLFIYIIDGFRLMGL